MNKGEFIMQAALTFAEITLKRQKSEMGKDVDSDQIDGALRSANVDRAQVEAQFDVLDTVLNEPAIGKICVRDTVTKLLEAEKVRRETDETMVATAETLLQKALEGQTEIRRVHDEVVEQQREQAARAAEAAAKAEEEAKAAKEARAAAAKAKKEASATAKVELPRFMADGGEKAGAAEPAPAMPMEIA
jgi:hypothetical protein